MKEKRQGRRERREEDGKESGQKGKGGKSPQYFGQVYANHVAALSPISVTMITVH